MNGKYLSSCASFSGCREDDTESGCSEPAAEGHQLRVQVCRTRETSARGLCAGGQAGCANPSPGALCGHSADSGSKLAEVSGFGGKRVSDGRGGRALAGRMSHRLTELGWSHGGQSGGAPSRRGKMMRISLGEWGGRGKVERRVRGAPEERDVLCGNRC